MSRIARLVTTTYLLVLCAASVGRAGHIESASMGGSTSKLITGLNVSGFGASDYEGMVDAVLNVWADASGFTNLGQVADGGVSAGASESID